MEKLRVRVWERRSASRGGRYFFILRGNEVLPMEKAGFAQKRDDVGRVAFYVEANLDPDDEVVRVDFTNSRNPSMYCCHANELTVEKDGLHDITTRKTAKLPTVSRFAQNANVPKWLRKQLVKLLPWARQ